MIMSLLSVVQPKLVEVPYNTVDLRNGSSAVMVVTCRSDFPGTLKWYVQKNHNSEKEPLYNGFYLRPDAKSYCTVKADEPGKIELCLGNTAEAAQTYICMEPGTLDEASADVVWIAGSDLVCTDSSTEDLVNLTCSIKFRGNWSPTMEWKEHNSHSEKFLSDKVNTVTVPNEHVTSTLVMEVQEVSRNYSCTTKFDINGKPQSTTARNIPNYSRVWMSSAFAKKRDQTITKPVNAIVAAVIPVTAVLLVGFICMYIVWKRRKESTKSGKHEANIKIHVTFLDARSESRRSWPDALRVLRDEDGKPAKNLDEWRNFDARGHTCTRSLYTL